MTHEEARERGMDAFLKCRPVQKVVCQDMDMQMREILRQQIEAYHAAYLEARGAVLCEAEPVGWNVCSKQLLYEDEATANRERDWFAPYLRVQAVHAALSDNPKGEAI